VSRRRRRAPDVELLPEDDATIFYTSGTTGKRRGRRYPSQHVLDLMNLFFINTRSTLRYGAGLAADPVKVQNAYLLSVPLFHATGCHAIMITNTAAAGSS